MTISLRQSPTKQEKHPRQTQKSKLDDEKKKKFSFDIQKYKNNKWNISRRNYSVHSRADIDVEVYNMLVLVVVKNIIKLFSHNKMLSSFFCSESWSFRSWNQVSNNFVESEEGGNDEVIKHYVMSTDDRKLHSVLQNKLTKSEWRKKQHTKPTRRMEICDSSADVKHRYM